MILTEVYTCLRNLQKDLTRKTAIGVYNSEDLQILKDGPENDEFYFDAWSSVLDQAYYFENGNITHYLHLSENGDLYAIRAGYSIDEFDCLIDPNGYSTPFY